VWTADLTYIWTAAGWLYLAIVLDLFNREVVGWSIKPRMTADIVVDALTMAWFRRKPAPGLLFHSDRGSQGGFNPSSQHFLIGGVDGYRKAWSRSSRTCKDAVARAPAGAASIGAAAVLAGDRRRMLERRRSAEGGSVAGGWFEMVSGVWRYAAIASCAVVAANLGTILVVS
jgi:hypothetical protein